MQTHGGADAEKVITAPERRFHVYLQVDWNMNGLYDHQYSNMSGYLSSATTDRSLGSSLAQAVSLVEGSAAAELEMELDGEINGLSLAAVFSPYQAASPLYGKPMVGSEVKYSIGVETVLGIIWYPQFVGYIRTVSPDRGSGYTTITALDRVELLRRPVQFPAWAMFGHQRVTEGRILGQLVDTQWVIDHCIRTADISPTSIRPATREENGLADDDITGPQLWVSGCGGYLPTIGWLDNWTFQKFADVEHGIPMYEQNGDVHPDLGVSFPRPQNLAALGETTDGILKYWGSDRDRINSTSTQIMGFTLVTRGYNNDWHKTCPKFKVMETRIGNFFLVQVYIEKGQVWTEWYDEFEIQTRVSPKVDIPTSGDSHRVVVAWDAFHASGALAWVQVGSNTSGASWTNTGSVPANVWHIDHLKGLVTIDHRVAMNDVFYTATNFGGLSIPSVLDWADRDATYAAVLDKGLNSLSYLPVRGAEDAWEVITNVVSAEFGTIFWDEGGVLRFWNQDTIAAKASNIVRDVSLDDISGLRLESNLDSVRNIYSLRTGRKTAFDNMALEGQSVEQFYCPPLQWSYFSVWSDETVSPNPGQIPRYASVAGGPYSLPAWTDDVIHGYVVEFLDNDEWVEHNDWGPGGVDINCYYNHRGEIIIKIWNGREVPARLAVGNQSALRVGGSQIMPQANQVFQYKNIGSAQKYGGRNLPLDSEWHQEFSNSSGFVEKALARTTEPIPVTDAITMAGDPRIQLADALRIRDPQGFGSDLYTQICGIRREWSLDKGLTDTYTIELTRPVGTVWDSGKWDTTLVWGV